MATRKFNNDKLYKELKDTIEQDKMYWLKNDAKLRAAVSSKSYEEFRDIVAAAHLQPLIKRDKERKHQNRDMLTDGK